MCSMILEGVHKEYQFCRFDKKRIILFFVHVRLCVKIITILHLGVRAKWLQYYIEGAEGSQIIKILNGERGSLGIPKSDFLIYVRPLNDKRLLLFFSLQKTSHPSTFDLRKCLDCFRLPPPAVVSLVVDSRRLLLLPRSLRLSEKAQVRKKKVFAHFL